MSAHEVTSSSDEEQAVGEAGNAQVRRQFSVADYSELLEQHSATRPTQPAASSTLIF